jgi:hypothetical protein
MAERIIFLDSGGPELSPSHLRALVWFMVSIGATGCTWPTRCSAIMLALIYWRLNLPFSSELIVKACASQTKALVPAASARTIRGYWQLSGADNF